MSKSEVKTRKSQLIHTFGPGAMQVNKDGISMLACGLDYWFAESGTSTSIDKSAVEKFIVQDERLASKLGVKEFRSTASSKVSLLAYLFEYKLPNNEKRVGNKG